MEGNKKTEKKPDRSALGAQSKDPQKAIAELEANRESRKKAQKQKQQTIIIVAALAAVIVLVVVLLFACRDKDATDKTSGSGNTDITNTDDPTVPVPSPTPTASQEPYSAEDYLAKLANNAEPYVAEKEIKVYTGGKPAGADQKKRIAIVLEGLNEYENLSKIITVAEGNGAKLTLLATGSVVDKDSELQAVLRQAYDKQFEIENHTYDEDKKLYSLPDEEMAYQIYMTQIAVNNALHVDYKMHFLYLPFDASHTHDQGQNDPRTHQYLDQLGSYVGVVGYTYKAIDAKKLDNIKNNAKDGSIMLFSCSNNDYNKLKEFIPWAVSQNFELVTLNELFGYDANEITNLSSSVDDSQVPAPKPYLYRPSITLGSKDYKQLYAVQLLQNRLKELGYLSDDYKADGYYGDQTTIAVKLFQRYNDLTLDGYAGEKTQLLLFSSEAKSNPSTYIADKPETYPPEEERAVFN